jgi:CBS domain-containing protein
MKRDVKCLNMHDTVHTAARAMQDFNIGFLPVCDEQQHVVGTVTDRDLAVRVLGANLTASTPIADVMTRDVVSCRAGDDLHDAEQQMASHRKSRLVIVDDGGRLCGVISLSDIAQFEKSARAADTLRKVSEREARPG